jgi:hypothetical protein
LSLLTGTSDNEGLRVDNFFGRTISVNPDNFVICLVFEPLGVLGIPEIFPNVWDCA